MVERSSKMRPIFDTCRPRPEVLAGDLTEDTFAARLRDVVEGKADAAYQDPAVFFRNTFPTEGLRTLTREVLGRLSGQEPANSPFVRLETSFGGGKTHNLMCPPSPCERRRAGGRWTQPPETGDAA